MGLSSVASRGEEFEKHRLENTVCYSLIWREFLVKFYASDTQTLEKVARGKFKQNFQPNFTTPVAEKNGEKAHSALLQGSCSEKLSKIC